MAVAAEFQSPRTLLAGQPSNPLTQSGSPTIRCPRRFQFSNETNDRVCDDNGCGADALRSVPDTPVERQLSVGALERLAGPRGGRRSISRRASVYPPPDASVSGGLTSGLAPLFPPGRIGVRSRLRELPGDGSVRGMEGWRWIPTLL
jgi:hypothetical protein